MSADPRIGRSAGREGSPWLPLLILGLATLLWTALALYVARDPGRRRRVINTAGRTWVRVEKAADASTLRLSPSKRSREARVRKIASELWDAVDDLKLAFRRVPIPSIPRRLYAHGAYMGAAPALLDDPGWRRILAFLMPDVYGDVETAAAKGLAVGVLMPMFENNPVMAAFGVWRSSDPERVPVVELGPGDLDSMEWDLFLSADLVDAWQAAPEPARPDLLVKLVDTMVIAHASTTDTMQEQIGLCQWGDVRRTRKTALGGVQPGAWLDLFGRALRLASAPDLAPAIRAMQVEARHEVGEECIRHTFVDQLTPAAVVAEYRARTGRPHLSVVIEVKSLRTPYGLLVALMEELNRRGLHVAAFGSFDPTRIRGLSTVAQQIGDQVLPGPREIVFLHFAGDVQAACEKGLLPAGTSAMFNGASLLLATRRRGRFEYGVDEGVVDELDDYRRRFDLQLGLYVQENDCDAEAVTLLSALVAGRPETFALGFAWGGALDEVALEAGLGDHRGFGSQRVLGRFGVAAASWKRRKASPA